jgi:hypothetical protein
MQIQTILNRVQKFKSFFYGTTRYIDSEKVPTILVELKPRNNSRPICSICRCKRAGYDTLPDRHFDFIPMWGNKIIFVYTHVESAVHAVVFG